MRDLFQKLYTAIRSGFWSKPSEVKDHGNPMDWKWVNDPFYDPDEPEYEDAGMERNRQIRMLSHRIENVREMMIRNKRNKKRWKHLEAKWNQLQDRRAKLSGTL